MIRTLISSLIAPAASSHDSLLGAQPEGRLLSGDWRLASSRSIPSPPVRPAIGTPSSVMIEIMSIPSASYVGEIERALPDR
ncbi:hypothetical protein AB0A63_31610 [Lentzea sp. NPDC042327]|uniref:hypothetical protein n=1 Tax=Lentzea sp. NPDC042327 TaxID=3154801 RepID=UPI0033EA38CA